MVLFLSDALEKTKTWPSKSLGAVILVMKSTLKNLNFMQHKLCSSSRIWSAPLRASNSFFVDESLLTDDFGPKILVSNDVFS